MRIIGRIPVITAVLAAAVLSCTPQNPDIVNKDKETKIFLKSGKPQLEALATPLQTKTMWNGESILWSGGDRINVFASKNGLWVNDSLKQDESSLGFFIVSPTTLAGDSQEASFEVPSDLIDSPEGDWLFYGAYPSVCLIDKQMCDTDGLRFRLSHRQVPIVCNGTNSFDPSCDLMVGKTEKITKPEDGTTYPIKWERLVSILSLNVEKLPYLSEDEVVTSICLQANEGASIVGDFRYELSTGQCKATSSSNIVNLISDGSNIVLSKGSINEMNACLIPQTITSLDIEIRTDRAIYRKSFDKLSCKLVRNVRTTLSLDMSGAKVDEYAQGDVSPDNSLIFNASYDICIPEHIIAQMTPTGMGTLSVYSPEVKSSGVFDIHLKIFPIHVFGTDAVSGDYYLVEGHILSHNAELYAERKYKNVRINAWYPSEFKLKVQMLSPEGKELEQGDANFFTDPVPSTTIGSWTYTKGSSFSIGPKLTFGIAKRDDVSGVLSWLNSVLGSISVGYTHNNSATQILPDQTVQVASDSKTAAVSYFFRTNNDTGGYSTGDIPAIFRNDQKIEFSWVWHLKSGKYCAKDNDFGNMKFKVTVSPTYKAAYKGTLYENQGHAVFKGWATYDHKDLILEGNMPAMNRIPAGDIRLSFAAMSDNYYLTNLKVYRSGEYAPGKAPYYSDTKAYRKDEVIPIQLREGTYDIVYKVQDGDGKTEKDRIIINKVVKADEILETSTLESKPL